MFPDNAIPSPVTPNFPASEMAALYRKIAAVMGEVHTVPKSKYNQQQGYSYASESDVMDCLRPLLSKHGIGFHARMKGQPTFGELATKNSTMKYVKVDMIFTLMDAETGAYIEAEWMGESADTLDKALGKAITYAKKTWAITTFMIATGDDEMDENGRGQQQGRGQQNQNRNNQQRPPQQQRQQSPQNGGGNGNGQRVETPLSGGTQNRIPGDASTNGKSGDQPVLPWPSAEALDALLPRLIHHLKIEALTLAEWAEKVGVADSISMSKETGWGKFAKGVDAFNAFVDAWTIPAQPKSTSQQEAQPAAQTEPTPEPAPAPTPPAPVAQPKSTSTSAIIEVVDDTELNTIYKVEAITARYSTQGKNKYLYFPMGHDERFKGANNKMREVRAYGRSDTFKAMIGDELYAEYHFDTYNEPRNFGSLLPLNPPLILTIQEKGDYFQVVAVERKS